MNQNAQRVIYRFTSEENRAFLQRQLADVPTVNMASLISHFVQRISNDLMTSDPIMSVDEQVECYNRMFVRDTRINMAPQEVVRAYGVRDGDITSRNTAHSRSSANEVLQSWKQNAYHGITARDDPQQMNRARNPVDVMGGNPRAACTSDRFAETGIVFCDQSNVGTSSHTERFLNNSYMQALNRDAPNNVHTNYAFGDSNADTDARLMSRRVFRDGGDGENTIPNYRRRLHRRAIDNDIDEDLFSPQHEFQQRGHDMQPLKDRIDYIRNYKESLGAKYAPPRDTYYSRDTW